MVFLGGFCSLYSEDCECILVYAWTAVSTASLYLVNKILVRSCGWSNHHYLHADIFMFSAKVKHAGISTFPIDTPHVNQAISLLQSSVAAHSQEDL